MTTVVITDDPAVADSGPSADGAWPGVLAGLAAQAGAPLDLEVAADVDAGLVADPGSSSFAELVFADVEHSTQLVVFAESSFDAAAPADVQQGAADAFAAVEEAAPDALVVMVAPWRAGASTTAPDPELRDAVRTAAAGAEVVVTLVDPVAAGWPTEVGQQELAELLHAELTPLIGALARSGAFE